MKHLKHIAAISLLTLFAYCGIAQKQDKKLAELKIDNQSNYIRFTVDNVHTSTLKLESYNYDSVVREKFEINQDNSLMDDFLSFKDSAAHAKSKESKETIKLLCIASKEHELLRSGSHSMVDALSIAYSQHRPITISPDMVWLMLMQGFGIHINENSESLRKKIVNFSGKKNLDVEVSKSFDMKSSFDWSNVIFNLQGQIKDNVGENLMKIANSRFSTTTLNEDLAYNIALMNSMSSYFNYSITLMCGIPEITLEGTIEDWQRIDSTAMELKKYNLNWWLQDLEPILREFVKARSGNINQKFWSNIFELKRKSAGCYTVDYLNGWILKFFPYISVNGSYMKNPVIGKKEGNELPKDGKQKANYVSSSNIKFENIPTGISKANVLVANKRDNTYTTCYLLSGFVGIAEDSITNYLKPEISWGVTESDKKPSKEVIEAYEKFKTEKSNTELK